MTKKELEELVAVHEEKINFLNLKLSRYIMQGITTIEQAFNTLDPDIFATFIMKERFIITLISDKEHELDYGEGKKHKLIKGNNVIPEKIFMEMNPNAVYELFKLGRLKLKKRATKK